MTEKKDRRKYTKEFKIEAVELARSHGGAAAVIARDLGIRPNMLYRWMSEYEADNQYAFPGLGKLKEPEEELRRLRRELSDIKMERDILKKALAIFSKQHPTNSGL
jgi:transposase